MQHREDAVQHKHTAHEYHSFVEAILHIPDKKHYFMLWGEMHTIPPVVTASITVAANPGSTNEVPAENARVT